MQSVLHNTPCSISSACSSSDNKSFRWQADSCSLQDVTLGADNRGGVAGIRTGSWSLGFSTKNNIGYSAAGVATENTSRILVAPSETFQEKA